MSLMARVWTRTGPIEHPIGARATRGFSLGPDTHFADTGQEVADAEHLVTLSLADLTAKLGDPWAAAVEMFGGWS